MEYAGAVSGAALGFISGDVPGAYYGARLGYRAGMRRKNLSQNSEMAPTTRLQARRRRARTSTGSSGYTTPRREQTARIFRSPPSTGRSMPSRRRLSAGRRIQNVMRSMASGDLVAKPKKVKGRRVRKEGRKKKVFVSKKLRKKINEVLKQKGPVGIVKEITPSDTMILQDNAINWQLGNTMQCDGVAGWAFSPTYIAQLYGILWNKQSFGAAFTTNRQASSFTFFNPNLKVHVIDQWYVIKFRNVSTRTMYLKLLDVSPKASPNQQTTYNTLQFIDNELSRAAPSGAAGSLTAQSNENPLGITKGILGFTPKLMTSFNAAYEMDETMITLEPGKEYYHKVKGPRNYTYNYQKFFRNAEYYSIQKFMKQTLVGLYGDLVPTSTGELGGAGRWTDMVASAGYGLVMEQEYFTKLKMPDQTGFQVRDPALAAGAVQNLSQRGYCYLIKSWYDGEAQSGVVQNITDENPSTVVSVAD